MRWLAVVVMGLVGCDAEPVEADPCAGDGARSTCLTATQPSAWYVDQSLLYFDTMDSTVEEDTWPEYSELVARWEWPPWLKLTGYTREGILATDTLLKLYPSTVPIRDCRFFDVQPFGRCRITFEYEAHENRPCPIYEEFTFNDAGETTFIEAWSDVDGLRPMAADDPWAEAPDVARLSTRVPGLGRPDGRIVLDSPEMEAAVAADPDVADLVYRAENWLDTWSAEFMGAPDDMWDRGCGW